MKTLKLEQFEQVTGLTEFEASQIDGEGFWYDLSYVLGATVRGFVEFATEGGRNAGICVR